MWRDYFRKGSIIGIDINLPKTMKLPSRIHLFEGGQEDIHFLAHVAKKVAPEGYDVIIDDASHIGEFTKKSFWYLFDQQLKPGGVFIIEDWGTGYWDNWPDGSSLDLNLYEQGQDIAISKMPFPCHSFGMVGFIKQLIDEQGAEDVTKYFAEENKRKSKFEQLIITPFLVIVKKSDY